MIISYSPEQQAANQAESYKIMTKFREVNGFSAVEWVLRAMQENRQKKQDLANKISAQVIRSYTIPTPKIQVTYAGIMLKLASRVEKRKRHVKGILP